MSFDVSGYCPMGCGNTLIFEEEKGVYCAAPSCPRSGAAGELLQDPETEHVVRITDYGYSIKHPMRERLDGELLDCEFHEQLGEVDAFHEIGAGVFSIWFNDHGDLEWDFRSI